MITQEEYADHLIMRVAALTIIPEAIFTAAIILVEKWEHFKPYMTICVIVLGAVIILSLLFCVHKISARRERLVDNGDEED